MAITTWISAGSNVYRSPSNWNHGVPNFGDAALFGVSNVTNPTISGGGWVNVGEWIVNPGASQYSFTIEAGTGLDFFGGGIIIDGGSVDITVESGSSGLQFDNTSTAGGASITNDAGLEFDEASTAGTAKIHTVAGAGIGFFDLSTGGNAQFITDTGGTIDFSHSSGPAGNHQLTAASIDGGGTYELGQDQLSVGLNVPSAEVSGLIEGVGGSLVKVGRGKLKLSGAGNTYTGGTILEVGKLDVAAVGAAGTGSVTFDGKATLKIENAALSSRHFGNPIDLFGKHDVLDLTGLHFHAGATATYHKASHHLAVHSGPVTDTLTLLSALGTHFAAASDHHGGTDVFLVLA